MAKARLRLFGFEKLRKLLSPSDFERRLRREVRAATSKNGLLAVSKIKKDISQQKFPNAGISAMTKVMKGSSKALVDTGELRKSIVSEVKRWDVVEFGVMKNRLKKDGRSIMQVAKALHKGATIKVTDDMRRYFFWLANSPESPVRGQVKPLSPNTKVIRIPPRPFLGRALVRSMIVKYRANWEAAVNRALRGAR